MLALPASKIDKTFEDVFALTKIPSSVTHEKSDVQFVQTPISHIEFIARRIGAKKGDIVYELGSGSGAVSCGISLITGATCYGLETRPTLVKFSREAASKLGIADRVEFFNVDFLRGDYDLRDATAIYFWLKGDVMRDTFNVLIQKADPYTRVLSKGFHIPRLKGREYQFNGYSFYLYRNLFNRI